MRRPTGQKEAGFTLVEVLVALVILAVAATGAMRVISNTMTRMEAGRLQSVMLAELGYRLDLGLPGEGEVVDPKTGRTGEWRVERDLVRSGQLAGVNVRWESVTASIVWRFRGQDVQHDLSRIEVVPSAGSASSRR